MVAILFKLLQIKDFHSELPVMISGNAAALAAFISSFALYRTS
jgi:hypothetical protein